MNFLNRFKIIVQWKKIFFVIKTWKINDKIIDVVWSVRVVDLVGFVRVNLLFDNGINLNINTFIFEDYLTIVRLAMRPQ